MERMLRELMGAPFPREGQGSGVIIDGENGYVLTNAHVVKQATRVEVTLADGRRLEAKPVGVDPLTDVAVLQVRGDDLPDAAPGSVSNLPIGSWVIAIGNPFGYKNSVTVGVVSAKDRQLDGQDGIRLYDLLQTDASINPGNSGGALVDLNGNVVGMPTAIIPRAQGMGFAIPSDVARQVAERLITTGKMPWIGISHRDVDPAVSRRLRLPGGKGALVVTLVHSGPAHRAGILPGDVILQVGDKPVKDARSLGIAVRAYNAGDRVRVRVWRAEREMSLAVTLGEVPVRGFR
jgi:serine protease Do